VPRLPFLFALVLTALASVSPVAGERLQKVEPLPVLDSGPVTVEMEGSQFAIEYSRTISGPLFTLQPLVARFGGDLEIGPLGQRHELEVIGTSFLFGPRAGTLTSGEEIFDLSQAPAPGPQGLLVPLDLLRRIYTQLMGFELRWLGEQRVLQVSRQPLREIPVTFNVVSLQGVTTLAFEFPTVPRYRIERSPSRVEIELIGDRLDVRSPRSFPADEYIRDVRLSSQSIIIDLAPRTRVQDYALESPFRLVFDVLPDQGQALARTDAVKPRRRGRRVETIIIDPGHGGSDTGAVGPQGTEEKRIALLIGRVLAQQLEQQLAVRSILTRNDDSELPLDSRAAIANENKGDLFISIHLNSSPDPSPHGAETYFLSLDPTDERAAEAARLENQAGADDDPLYDLQLILWDLAQTSYMSSSQRFAGFVQAELNSTLGLRDRGVKQAPFRVLIGAAMPAVLVELGFLNNPEEESRLLSPEYRANLVASLVRAVSRYVAITEGRPETTSESVVESPAE
jgi:N-acetylmuramoyl-L-alanine amidase